MRDEQPHREGRNSALFLITANTAIATATNAAFSDFPYFTSLRKRANTTTISNFLIWIRYKRHVLNEESKCIFI